MLPIRQSSVVITLIYLIALASTWSSAAAQVTPSIQWLGDLPGGIFVSDAKDISTNGEVVVGVSEGAEFVESFRWDAVNGMLPMTAGDLTSEAHAVSFDGSVVVGRSYPNLDVNPRAFRWENGVMELLPPFSGQQAISWAWATNAPGSIVVGASWTAQGFQPCFWQSGVPIVGLSGIQGQGASGRAEAISADGSVIAGWTSFGQGWKAVRWTDVGEPAERLDPTGTDGVSYALAISSNGGVIVGITRGEAAFRWTEETGMEELAPVGTRATARDVSDDGCIIVGETWLGPSTVEAFIWEEPTGMRILSEVLENEFGLDLTGWDLTSASGVRADNESITIVGVGNNPSGTEAWIATIPRTPGQVCLPILPDTGDESGWNFVDAVPERWIDPPAVPGFRYVMTSEDLFTAVLDFPAGFDNPFTVSVLNVELGQFSPGEPVVFADFADTLGAFLIGGEGVEEFTVTGITPLVDAENPMAFPIKLDYNAPAVDLTMIPLSETSDVPGDTELPGSPALDFQITPNPFTNRTEINFRALEPIDGLLIEIFDVDGRRLHTLFDGTIDAGQHRIDWDGSLEDGSPVGSGVYYVRMNRDGILSSGKVMKVQ